MACAGSWDGGGGAGSGRAPDRVGVVVAAVPWARHRAGHTRFFDGQVAWLAVQRSKTVAMKLMRIAWRPVGAIITRVVADIDASVDRLEGLRRIGIDEISYEKIHRYITVVIDHDTKRLVWAAPGRGKTTVRKFFDALAQQRSKLLTHVPADGAEWIADVVKVRAPQAIRCADPFYVVAWASEALDVLRRQAWNKARALARTEPKGRAGRPRKDGTQAFGPRPGHDLTKALKSARYALWKNPENLTETQRSKLNRIATTDPRPRRGYLLKEGLGTPCSAPAATTHPYPDAKPPEPTHETSRRARFLGLYVARSAARRSLNTSAEPGLVSCQYCSTRTVMGITRVPPV